MAVTYKFEYHPSNNFLNLIVMLRKRESVGTVGSVRSQKGLQSSLKGLKTNLCLELKLSIEF